MQEFDHICYKKNYIKEIICLIEFEPILKFKENAPAEFQDLIREKYPIFIESDAFSQTFQIEKGKFGSKGNDAFKRFQFSNKEKTTNIFLQYFNLVFQTLKYNTFEEFKTNIDFIFSSFNNIYRPIALKRLGLRYINEIVLDEGNPFQWDDLLNPSLVSIFKSFIPTNELTRAITQLSFDKEDFKETFTFGIPNGEFPNKIARKQFILDIDCSCNEAEFNKISELLDKFHSEIQQIFEQSIADGLRKKMEE